MDDDNVMKIVQYSEPPVWMEWTAYTGAVALFAACVINPTMILWPLALTAMLLYWNYRLFVVIKEYVRYVNASEFSKLMTALAENEINKQKDGTFQDSDCLTKEKDSEEGSD